MQSSALWLIFAGLFLVAGALNAARAYRPGHPRKRVRLVLAASCVVWAAAALTYRFAGTVPGYAVSACAGLLMAAAAAIAALDAK